MSGETLNQMSVDCISIPRPITDTLMDLPFPDVDAAMLEYAIWHSPKLQHGEEVYIRDKKTNQTLKASYHEEEGVFYVGDGEIKPWQVQWRRIFPESTLERAAINYLAILQKREIPVIESLALEVAVAKALNPYVEGFDLKDCVDDILAAITPYLRLESVEPIELAKLIASGLGYEWDTLYNTKQGWIEDKGKRHDINTPYKVDFMQAADAVLSRIEDGSANG